MKKSELCDYRKLAVDDPARSSPSVRARYNWTVYPSTGKHDVILAANQETYMCQVQKKHDNAMDHFEMRDNAGKSICILHNLYRAADDVVEKGPFSPFDVL